MSELAPFFVQKAKDDFGEDEKQRRKSLEKFKHWIQKHPFMTFTDLDETCLLMFLRGRKYQMDKVCQSLEQMAVFQKSHPEWNKIDEKEMPMFLRRCTNGLGLSNYRDVDGRKVVVIEVKKQEDLDLSQNDYFKILQVFLNGCLYEEETQIAGVVFVFDLRGITFNLLRKYSLMSILEFFSQLKYCPIRIKQINLVGLPSFALIMFKFVRKMLSEKLQKRINLMKNLEDLSAYLDTSQLLLADASDYNRDSYMNTDEYIKRASRMYDSFEVDFERMKRRKSQKLNEFD